MDDLWIADKIAGIEQDLEEAHGFSLPEDGALKYTVEEYDETEVFEGQPMYHDTFREIVVFDKDTEVTFTRTNIRAQSFSFYLKGAKITVPLKDVLIFSQLTGPNGETAHRQEYTEQLVKIIREAI